MAAWTASETVSGRAAAVRSWVPWLLRTYCRCFNPVLAANQGLTLVHFSAQPDPFLTQNTL